MFRISCIHVQTILHVFGCNFVQLPSYATHDARSMTLQWTVRVEKYLSLCVIISEDLQLVCTSDEEFAQTLKYSKFFCSFICLKAESKGAKTDSSIFITDDIICQNFIWNQIQPTTATISFIFFLNSNKPYKQEMSCT